MQVGDKIKMDGERLRYTVQAANDRYVIATKPFNARRTYIYTIIDLTERRRGPINLIFGICGDVNSPEGASAMLRDMAAEGWSVSRRHDKPLSEAEAAQVFETQDA